MSTQANPAPAELYLGLLPANEIQHVKFDRFQGAVNLWAVRVAQSSDRATSCQTKFCWAVEMTRNSSCDSPLDKSFPSVDPMLLRAVAAKLADSRQNPPTVMRTLSKWPGTPMLVLIGVAGTAILAFLAAPDDSALTSHWPLGFAAMIFGAFLRDLGLARRVTKLWAPQSHFIDWAKVDELAS